MNTLCYIHVYSVHYIYHLIIIVLLVFCSLLRQIVQPFRLLPVRLSPPQLHLKRHGKTRDSRDLVAPICSDRQCSHNVPDWMSHKVRIKIYMWEMR